MPAQPLGTSAHWPEPRCSRSRSGERPCGSAAAPTSPLSPPAAVSAPIPAAQAALSSGLKRHLTTLSHRHAGFAHGHRRPHRPRQHCLQPAAPAVGAVPPGAAAGGSLRVGETPAVATAHWGHAWAHPSTPPLGQTAGRACVGGVALTAEALQFADCSALNVTALRGKWPRTPHPSPRGTDTALPLPPIGAPFKDASLQARGLIQGVR